jgi:hypothetical protein
MKVLRSLQGLRFRKRGMYRLIERCRICGGEVLEPILDLGAQALTGVFPRSTNEPVSQGPLDLVKCHGEGGCGLVQLRESYDPDEMYGQNYGYRSGLNASMVAHLRDVVSSVCRRVELGPGDLVIDIGSNDSTLLQGYAVQGLERLGVDPTGRKFSSFYPPGIALLPEFFTASSVRGAVGPRKAKALTSIAMLYDLEEPLRFFAEVREVLHDEGVWVFEQSYLPTMLRMNAYDTVCQEHLEYYGLSQIRYMTERAGFKIVGVELNAVNGGSFCVAVAKRESSHPEAVDAVDALLEEEDPLRGLGPYEEFRTRVFRHRDDLRALLLDLKARGESVLGYGASTKGNVILQFCGITPELLPAIAEVNPDKYGRVTPGTGIPIVSEDEAKSRNPRNLLVLPWHFRENLIERERDYLRSGGRLIFPLPRIETYRG